MYSSEVARCVYFANARDPALKLIFRLILRSNSIKLSLYFLIKSFLIHLPPQTPTEALLADEPSPAEAPINFACMHACMHVREVFYFDNSFLYVELYVHCISPPIFISISLPLAGLRAPLNPKP